MTSGQGVVVGHVITGQVGGGGAEGQVGGGGHEVVGFDVAERNQISTDYHYSYSCIPIVMKMFCNCPLASGISHLYLPVGEVAPFLLFRRMKPSPLFL